MATTLTSPGQWISPTTVAGWPSDRTCKLDTKTPYFSPFRILFGGNTANPRSCLSLPFPYILGPSLFGCLGHTCHLSNPGARLTHPLGSDFLPLNCLPCLQDRVHCPLPDIVQLRTLCLDKDASIPSDGAPTTLARGLAHSPTATWLLQAWFPPGLSFVVTLDKDHSFLPKSTRVSNGHQVGGSDLLRLNPIVCPSDPRP